VAFCPGFQSKKVGNYAHGILYVIVTIDVSQFHGFDKAFRYPLQVDKFRYLHGASGTVGAYEIDQLLDATLYAKHDNYD
jgi:uncharacterized protein YigE (DUF2233 family)